MNQYEELLKMLLEAVQKEEQKKGHSCGDGKVPVGVSNRHVHLSQADLERLFGPGYELNRMKDLSQPGQYACKEVVTVCGPKGAIEKVRILGPVRKDTQVEILAGDCFKLGVKAPVRLSGDLDGTPGITLVGPKGSVQTEKGVMIAQRHIHMHPSDAEAFGVHDGQAVDLEAGGARGGILKNTVIRVTGQSKLECHVDMEEANAFGLDGSMTMSICS